MNLFKTALVAAVCVAAASTPSFAAKATGGGWGGPYAGLSVGYLQDKTDFYDPDNYFCDGCWFSAGSANNLTFGGQAGYNWQSDKLVYGFEADAKGVYGEKLQGNDSSGLPFMGQTINGAYSLRGRIGMTTDYDAMLYATGGFALLQTNQSHMDSDEFDGAGRLYTGWTAGVGGEKKLNSTYSAKLEATWSEFTSQKKTDATDEGAFGADPSTFGITAGVNYHF